MAAEDKKRRELIEAKDQAVALIQTAERWVAEVGDKLDAANKSAVEEAVEALKTATKGDDVNEIRQKTDALHQVSPKLREVIDKAVEQESTAEAGGAPGTAAAEDSSEAVEAKRRESAILTSQVTGAFEIRTHDTHRNEVKDKIEFNIKPKEEFPGPIPEEQREINYGVYGTWGVLKLLREQGVFKDEDNSFTEFRGRLLQVAEVGLAAKHVRTHLAAKALDQIREEISLRKGITIKLKYLSRLAGWALLGVAAGASLVYIAAKGIPGLYSPDPSTPGLKGYGWVVIGSMAGAWMSVASTRRKVAFEEMPDFLSSRFEPLIRLIFVGLLAASFALFLQHDLLTLKVSEVDFKNFSSEVGVALLLGLIAGISEKAVSVRIISRAQKALAPGSS